MTNNVLRQHINDELLKALAAHYNITLTRKSDGRYDTKSVSEELVKDWYKTHGVKAPHDYTQRQYADIDNIRKLMGMGGSAFEFVEKLAIEFENTHNAPLTDDVEEWLEDNKPADKKQETKSSSANTGSAKPTNANTGGSKTQGGSTVKK